MNLDLGSNTNKMILLVVAGIALLLALNVYQKQVGKNIAILLSFVVIVVVGFFGYRLLNEDDDVDIELNNLLNGNLNSNVNGNANVNGLANVNGNANVNGLANVNGDDVLEHFEGGETTSVEEEEEELDNNNVNDNINANVTENVSTTNVLNNNNLDSDNLMPEGETLFSNVNPSNNGGVINASLLNAGHHIGVNTQGCSLRNANRGLRSEPANPQTQVSPWLQTTICPDLYRKPLE